MITEIENAAIAALRTASDDGSLGFTFGTLESYPAEWDAYLKEKSGSIRAPGGWIVFSGWGNPVNSSADNPVLPVTFAFVVMSENYRSDEKFSRQGDPVDTDKPGSNLMAERIARFFAGKDLGLPIEAIEIGACRPVRPPEAMKERKVSMLAIELRTSFLLSAIPDGSDLDDFETFHANWDIPVFGNVDAAPGTTGIQIPADATADATDNLTMEQ